MYLSGMYDWAERQPRVDWMLRALRQRDLGEIALRDLTVGQLITAIETGSGLGRELVSIYGLVAYARRNSA